MIENVIIAAARADKRSALDEESGKKLLAEYGIAVPKTVVVPDANSAAAAISDLRFPLVVKVVSPDILHKSDAGGVAVGLPDADAVTAMES